MIYFFTSLFWAASGTIAYAFAGYPLLVKMLARFFGKDIVLGDYRPTITVIIAAYNEEKDIHQKISNVLSLSYPSNKLDVIVASDASSDSTDSIVLAYGARNVQLLRVEGRRGKTACQNSAAHAATGEILLFTDATTQIESDALLLMSRNFYDDSIGCVAGLLAYRRKGADATSAGGTAYWTYESGVRCAESRLGSLIGVSGCFYALRRSMYKDINADLISDFVIAMKIKEQNARTVLETGAVCYEETLNRGDQELSMRIRVTLRSLVALWSERRFLNPIVYGVFAWQLISHKLLRYLSPFFWIISIVSCCFLADSIPIYRTLLVLQILLLASGALAFILQSRNVRIGVLYLPYYFVLTNIASLLAAYKFMRGQKAITWQPIR